MVTDVGAQVRDILAFHLGSAEARLTDEARLAKDLGADSLDVIEIVMSCEERFEIEIPNSAASTLLTVGDAIALIEAQLARPAAPAPERRPIRRRLSVRRRRRPAEAPAVRDASD